MGALHLESGPNGESLAGGRVVIQERAGRTVIAILRARGSRVYRALRAIELEARVEPRGVPA